MNDLNIVAVRIDTQVDSSPRKCLVTEIGHTILESQLDVGLSVYRSRAFRIRQEASISLLFYVGV